MIRAISGCSPCDTEMTLVTHVADGVPERHQAAQFQGYAALVIGDPSSGSCSTLVPTTGTSGSDAIGTTWQGAVTGNLAILGAAPAVPGSNAASTHRRRRRLHRCGLELFLRYRHRPI